MKYYLVAGEASGDLHGSNLIKSLKLRDKNAQFRCWGGDLMEAAGATVVKHYRELAFMGFVEVIRHLPKILTNLKNIKKDITLYQPDVIIFIDYPGFNLRITEWAHNQGFKTCYYISPTVWAWKENRVNLVKKYVDKMMVILPFEKAFYKTKDCDVVYVGHPLVEVIDASLNKLEDHLSITVDKPIIALLPGSRTQEIKTKLPIMLKMVDKFPEFQFVIGQAPSQPLHLYEDLIKGKAVAVVNNQTYPLLKNAKAALVTSGTATLETALFGVPQVVCYISNPISYYLAKNLVKIKYISLVNLILDKKSVTELIQNDLNENRLFEELSELLYNKERQEQLQADYTELWELLYNDESASNKAAEEVLKVLKK